MKWNLIGENKKYLLILSVFTFLSCKNQRPNYISYYNKVNEIDSIYRIAKQPEKALIQYKRLFRKYEPKNQERIEEFETYIKLADQYNKNFGGKKNLYKLLKLVAPYGNSYQNLYPLYQKYGIDSLSMKNEIANWKNNLNRRLVDSFSVAFIRDQQDNRSDVLVMKKNDKKNAMLLKWTFENYGYPSLQKIGLTGNNGVFMPMLTLFSHMSTSEYYPYFKSKLLDFVKSGDCLPRDYATMVDRHNLQVSKEKILYGYYSYSNTIMDTININHNRKTIGLPSLNHAKEIRKDFFKEMNKK